jgi:hypothetical protein
MNTSIGTMLRLLSGLVGTKDVTPWENDFLKRALALSDDGKHTTRLSINQIEKVTEIYERHFAG